MGYGEQPIYHHQNHRRSVGGGVWLGQYDRNGHLGNDGAVQGTLALAIPRAAAENIQSRIYKLADMSTGWYGLQITRPHIAER